MGHASGSGSGRLSTGHLLEMVKAPGEGFWTHPDVGRMCKKKRLVPGGGMSSVGAGRALEREVVWWRG